MQSSHLILVADNCIDTEEKKKLLYLIQNLCEENEFVLANYYVPIAKTNKMTCEN